MTRFFRDDAAFEALEHRDHSRTRRARPIADEQIRVWVPGCATGQEAYSIAMLLHERAGARGNGRSTSRSSRPTCTRRRSRSPAPASTPRSRSPASARTRLRAVLHAASPNGYQISQTLRESIVFAPHNLIRDAPFTKMDLITCRNLLIYFQPHAQKTVLTLFHFALKPGGFLFLGSSETPGRPARRVRHHRRAREDLPEAARHRPAARPEAAAAARAARCRAGRRRRPRGGGGQPAAAGGLRPAARSLHAAELPRRRARPAGRHLRRRRVAAEGQGAAAVAEPARHARATSCARWCRARCTACAAMLESVRYPAVTIAGATGASRWSPNRSATRTAR